MGPKIIIIKKTIQLIELKSQMLSFNRAFLGRKASPSGNEELRDFEIFA